MKKRPLTIFADLHLHDHTAFATDRDGFNSRLMDSQDIVYAIAESAMKHGCTDIIHAGDWFHSRRRVSVPVLDVSERILNKCAKDGVRIHTIPGNHDYSLDGKACSIIGQPFASVTTEHGSVREIAGWRVCFIPWTDDPDVVSRSLEVTADLYVGHFGVEGAKVGPSDFEIPGHIHSRVFRDVKKPVFLGHYHKPQSIPDTTAMYVGSPLQQGWGEAGEDKRCVRLMPDGKIKSIALPSGPRFLRLKPDELSKARPIDFVEVMVDTVKQIRRVRNLVDNERVDAPTSIVLREAPKADAPVLDLTGLKHHAQLAKYISHTGVPDGVTKKELIRAGLELLGEG